MLGDPRPSPEYTVEFFQQLTLVMKALDNRAGRMTKMCLAADVPQLESG